MLEELNRQIDAGKVAYRYDPKAKNGAAHLYAEDKGRAFCGAHGHTAKDRGHRDRRACMRCWSWWKYHRKAAS